MSGVSVEVIGYWLPQLDLILVGWQVSYSEAVTVWWPWYCLFIVIYSVLRCLCSGLSCSSSSGINCPQSELLQRILRRSVSFCCRAVGVGSWTCYGFARYLSGWLWRVTGEGGVDVWACFSSSTFRSRGTRFDGSAAFLRASGGVVVCRHVCLWSEMFG